MELIERQSAIDALKGLPTWWADEGGYYGGAQPPMVALLDPEDAVSAIENLASAQPEIVMCKDCKHRPIEKDGEIMPPKEDDWKCPCLCDDYFYSWRPKDNFFCASGERR